MKDDIKQRWIAALRSGDYAQGKGYLATGHKFCCLGVLCELAVADVIINKYDDISNIRWYGNNYDEECTTLPAAVQRWAGLDSDDPYIETEENTLAAINDAGYTFEQIANLIDSEL